jgi:hypothetical protein
MNIDVVDVRKMVVGEEQLLYSFFIGNIQSPRKPNEASNSEKNGTKY